MAEQGPDAEDRTEAATPRRLQKAREEGQVALSREVPTFAVLAAAALTLALVVPDAAHRLAARLSLLLEHAHELEPGAALRASAVAALAAAAPLVFAALLAGAAGVLLQTGFLVNARSLQPDLSRLSVVGGFRRLFGATVLAEAAKAVVKAVAAGAVLWAVLSGARPDLRGASFWTVPGLADHSARLLLKVLLATLAVQALVTVVDVVRVRLQHARDLRMSRQDMKEESRDSEGDPQVKARLRQLRMQRAKQRMMAAVPKATVVITNPTHYAVALVYDRAAGGAPRVVAKGVDAVAARIRAVAEENRVPQVANPPIARALYRVELDAEIPAEHFQAVAEIIAYVWRLRGASAGGAG
jgi:flagellar biosynthetic protein FlhB